MLLGVHLTLLMGPTLAVPAPLPLAEALSAVEITQSETGRSGFQLTFQVGRSGPFDLLDYNLLTIPLLRPFTRVVVMVLFNLTPTVLLDGIITQVQLTPSEEPGASTLSVTGEDVSVLMDLEERVDAYDNEIEILRVVELLVKYPQLSLIPDIRPPTVPDLAISTRRIPKQNGTDYQYIQTLASRAGFVFYVRPGLLPNTNIAYFGPPGQPDLLAQAFKPPALSVNMGPQTNVNSVNFTYNALALEQVKTERTEPNTNTTIPIMSVPLSTDPPLALMPALIYQMGQFRVVREDQPPTQPKKAADENADDGALAGGRAEIVQTFARAQGRTNASAMRAVEVSGELDALRYGAALQARVIVDLRGVGATFDGSYYVKSVTHSIRKGEYKQRFTLKRGGVYPLSPVVSL